MNENEYALESVKYKPISFPFRDFYLEDTTNKSPEDVSKLNSNNSYKAHLLTITEFYFHYTSLALRRRRKKRVFVLKHPREGIPLTLHDLLRAFSFDVRM